jgi:hypothetical protein
MISELRGEGEGDADVQQAIAELLDRLIERLTEEGYITMEGGAPTDAGPTQDVTGPGRRG